MKIFSQIITEPLNGQKSNTNEFVIAATLLSGALLAYACKPLIVATGKGMESFWGFLFDKDRYRDKDKDKGKDKDEDKSKQNSEVFNSLLMLAKESNKNEKNKNEKSKNDAMLKLLTACSFDKDGNEIPLEDRINKMKDTMSDEQFESFKKDMTSTYEKYKDDKDFKDALEKAKSNIKAEDYDKMIDEAKKEAKSTLEQIAKEKKEIEEHNRKIQDLEDEINGADEKDKEIRELKRQLEDLKQNPPSTIAGTATGVEVTKPSGEEGDDKEVEDYSNEDIEKMQDEISDLDPEKDKDKIKEKEELLKSIAKAKGKSEDEYLPKSETGSDGKQYQHKTGPRGGKYYRVKAAGKSWGPWNSGEPANESLKCYLNRLLNS